MADIAITRASHLDPTESNDSATLLLAAAGILAIFLAITAVSPSGVGHGAEHLSTMLGF